LERKIDIRIMKKRLLPLLLLLFLTIIFFWENIFSGFVFYFGDNFNLFIPNKTFLVNSIKAGLFPLWNPLILSGTPYIADLAIFPFYPGNLFFLVFSAEVGLTFLAIVQVFLAGVFMRMYLAKIGFGKFSSFLGAVIFMFSGSVVTHIGNISILNVIIWLPIILFYLEKVFENGKFKDIFLLALFLTISFLGGHLQFFYYNGLFIFFYTLFKVKADFRQKLSRSLLISLIFFGLCAFQLLPFLEFANLSTRPVGDFSYSAEGSISPVVTLRFFLAEIYGRLKDGYSWGPGAPMERGFADATGYIGVIPLFFIFWLILKKGKKQVFWIASFFLFLFASFGKYTPVFGIFYKIVPFFNRFRNPAQFLFLYSFCGIVISLYGFNFFLKEKIRNGKKIKILLTVFGLLFGLSLFFVGRGENLVGKTLTLPLAYNFEKLAIIFELFFTNLAIIFLAAGVFLIILFLYQKGLIKRRLFEALLVLVVFFDLFNFSKNSLFSADKKVYQVPSGARLYLEENLGLGERFLSTSEIIAYTGLFNYWNQTMVREPFGESRVDKKEVVDFEVLAQETAVLPPNLGMNYSLATVNGYSSMVISDYAGFWDPKGESKNINNILIKDFDDEGLDLLGVKYLVVDKDLSGDVEKVKGFSLVFSDGFVKIYRNSKAYQRTFLIDQERVKTKITDYQPNKVAVETNGGAGGLLVLTDNYYPGWEVFVDGEKSKLERYKGTFRAVKIKKGEKKVEFLFKPWSFYIGLLITSLTLVLCLGKLVWLSAAKMKKR